MRSKQSQSENGFAGLEAVLVIIIIGIVLGVGYWVTTQRKSNSVASTQATTNTPAPKAITATKGTAESVDQLTKADGQSEDSIDKQYETNEQSNVTTSASAQKGIGGAYNESSL